VNFDAIVTELCERCPGARGVAIVDPDGIPVSVTPRDANMEALGAEFASILRDVDQAGREFRHGSLLQFSVFAADAIVVLTAISAGYFILLVLGRDGLVGKSRFLSRLAGERLHSEFV
jgi:predicted regulator of Ras-like GTPase activity (Roadblock/LC7/MglB family)